MTPEALEALGRAREKARESRIRQGELTRKQKELEQEIARNAVAEREAEIERLRKVRDAQVRGKPRAKPAPAPAARRRKAQPPPEPESEYESEEEYSEEGEEEAPPPPAPRRRAAPAARPPRAPRARAPARFADMPSSHDNYYVQPDQPPAPSRIPEPPAQLMGDQDMLRAFFPNL